MRTRYHKNIRRLNVLEKAYTKFKIKKNKGDTDETQNERKSTE